jgi:hypothetical protein
MRECADGIVFASPSSSVAEVLDTGRTLPAKRLLPHRDFDGAEVLVSILDIAADHVNDLRESAPLAFHSILSVRHYCAVIDRPEYAYTRASCTAKGRTWIFISPRERSWFPIAIRQPTVNRPRSTIKMSEKNCRAWPKNPKATRRGNNLQIV